MIKIVYVLPAKYEQKPIEEIAKEHGIEVKIAEIPKDMEAEKIRECIRQWEIWGAEIILCRGNTEKRIKKWAKQAWVLGVQFSFEATLSILWSYKKKHPDFFGEKKKRVMLLSSYCLVQDTTLLQDIFNVETENVALMEQNISDRELIERGRKFDLVICGSGYVDMFLNHGINAYFHIFPEIQTLHHNFRMSKLLAASHRQMKEKNDEIRNLLDSSFHAIVSLDKKGQIIYGNGQLRRYFKAENREIEGQSIFDFIPSLDSDLLNRGMEREHGFYGELVEMDHRMLVMNGFPMYSRGEVSGLALSFEELKQIEKVEQKVKAEFYSKGLVAKYRFDDILGESAAIKEAKDYARSFARHSSNVLIYGESGAGKELFAQSIHNCSERRESPFVAINCGALPVNLLESELFGYVGGAFTGASKNGKKGFLELAHKGTIFLDEISEMDPMGQIRLLRVLEERVISRIGDDRVIPVDLRIIAASNKNLQELAEQGKFREDLYYRLNVLMLQIPPLRERIGDVRLLTDYFLKHFGELNKKQVWLDAGSYRALENCPWRGNVRQLRNFCERLVIIAPARQLDEAFVVRQLNNSCFQKKQEPGEPSAAENPERESGLSENDVSKRESEEKRRIMEVLNHVGGRREAAAAELNISKTSLWRKMKKYNILEKY